MLGNNPGINPRNFSDETIAAIMSAQTQPFVSEVVKSWTQPGSATTGIQSYELHAPSLKLYPVLTPLRNMIPRIQGAASIQANWRAVTGLNTGVTDGGVEEGKRGGIPTTSTADYFAAFRTVGLDDYVTFQAQWAAMKFEDLRAFAGLALLQAVMLREERMDLGGLGTFGLGTTGTPTLTDVTTGGSLLANTAYNVICVAMTPAAYESFTVASGLSGQVTRNNGDGTTTTYNAGAAQKSASGTVTTAADASNTHQIRMSVTAVTGAVAYAWYIGAGAGAERLASITTINSAQIAALNGSGQLASALTAADYSQNSLHYDGILSQAAKSGSGAYYTSLATGTPGTGTTLTAGTDGTIAEFDAALQDRWDNYRLSPSTIWVSSQEKRYLRKKIVTGSSSMMQRFNFSAEQGGIRGGLDVKSYINPFGMGGSEEIPIRTHPNLPPGTVMMTTDTLPYPANGVTNVFQKLLRQEYWQNEWPLKTMRYELGVYFDGVLQGFFPPGTVVINNIAAG